MSVTDQYIACMREVGLHDIADMVHEVLIRHEPGLVSKEYGVPALHSFKPDITVIWSELPRQILNNKTFARYHSNAARLIHERLARES